MSKREELFINRLVGGTVANGRGGSLVALSLTPAEVAAATVAEQNVTVAGLTTSDLVFVGNYTPGNATALAGARVSAANTLTLRFVNPTAGALTPGAGTYNFLVIRTK